MATLTYKSNPGDPLITAGLKGVVYSLNIGTYTTGGVTCDVSGYLTNEVYGMVMLATTSAAGGYRLIYKRAASGAPATGKVMVYYNASIASVTSYVKAAQTEVSNNKSLTTVGAIVLFLGR